MPERTRIDRRQFLITSAALAGLPALAPAKAESPAPAWHPDRPYQRLQDAPLLLEAASGPLPVEQWRSLAAWAHLNDEALTRFGLSEAEVRLLVRAGARGHAPGVTTITALYRMNDPANWEIRHAGPRTGIVCKFGEPSPAPLNEFRVTGFGFTYSMILS